MAKENTIIIRCDLNTKKSLKLLSQNYGINISDLVRGIIENNLREPKGNLDKNIRDKIKNLQRESDLKKISKEWKSDNRGIYLIKNFLVGLRNMLLSSYIVTNELNMEIVKIQIKHANDVYKKLPLKIRKALKEEMAMINNQFVNESYLKEKFDYMLGLKNRKLLK